MLEKRAPCSVFDHFTKMRFGVIKMLGRAPQGDAFVIALDVLQDLHDSVVSAIRIRKLGAAAVIFQQIAECRHQQ